MRMLSLLPGMMMHQLRKIMTTGKPLLLSPGTMAPEFGLQDESGNFHTLSQYKGKKVILWWFVRASTPG